jgi:hypothetical protein
MLTGAARFQFRTTKFKPSRPNPDEGTRAESDDAARQFAQGDGMAVKRTTWTLCPLCYVHHVEMKPVQLKEVTHSFITLSLAYRCTVSGCAISYTGNAGYFAGGVQEQRKQTGALRVSCPLDGQPMYLAAIHPEDAALRLWRCAKPNCPGHSTIEEFIIDPKDPFIQQLLRAN